MEPADSRFSPNKTTSALPESVVARKFNLHKPACSARRMERNHKNGGAADVAIQMFARGLDGLTLPSSACPLQRIVKIVRRFQRLISPLITPTTWPPTQIAPEVCRN
jgi:hypothetical protein